MDNGDHYEVVTVSYDTEQNQSVGQAGLSADQRQTMLLDDLKHELERLTDAVERQNELLEQLAADETTTQ